MKKAKAAYLSLAAAGVIVLAGVVSCGLLEPVSRYLRSGPVGWKIYKEIRQEGITSIDIAHLTDFQWDELHIIGPYQFASMEELCRAIRVDYDNCRNKLSFNRWSDDSVNGLVFKDKGRIVHSEVHWRVNGDFRSVPEGPLKRNEGKFVVRDSGERSTRGEPWLYLHHQK